VGLLGFARAPNLVIRVCLGYTMAANMFVLAK